MTAQRRPSRALLAVLAAVAVAGLVLVLVLGDGEERTRTVGPDGHYVDPDSLGGRCSDGLIASAARSAGTPWCSLQRAVRAAPPGATVVLRRATYPEVRIARGLRLHSYPGERASLGAIHIDGSGVRLEGLDIRGTVTLEAGVSGVLVARNRIEQRGPANAIDFRSTDTLPPISDVTIRDNRIGPVAGGGDAIQAKNTRGLTVEGNEIFGVRLPPGSAAHPDAFQSIYGAVDLTLRRNFIHDIAAQGIFVQDFRGANNNLRAEDNVIARVAYPWVPFSFSADGARVVHNTVGGILRVFAGTRDAALVANIASSFLYSPGVRPTREEYNLGERFSAPLGRGSVTGTPRYRDPERNDFRLTPGTDGSGEAPDGGDLGSRHADWSDPG